MATFDSMTREQWEAYFALHPQEAIENILDLVFKEN